MCDQPPLDQPSPAGTSQHWDVISVFDPDGTGSDFAYTVGLWPAHPELHLWARPTDGDDPGEDWMFSPNDRARILNHVARRCLSGELAAGSPWDESFDGGLASVTFTISAPEPAPAFDTFQLPADTPVCTLRWSLERPEPRAVADPVDAGTIDRILATARRLDAVRAPEGAVIDPLDAAACDPAGQFGPWTPVLVRMRAMVHDEHAAAGLAAMLGTAVSMAPTAGYGLSVCTATATAHGRRRVLDAAIDAARDDAAFLGSLPGLDDDIRLPLTGLLTTLLAAGYGAWVVRDLVDVEVAHLAAGWLDALLDPASATDRFAAAVCALVPDLLEEILLEQRAGMLSAVIPGGLEGTDGMLYERQVWLAHLGYGAPLYDSWVDTLGLDREIHAGADGRLESLRLRLTEALCEHARNAHAPHEPS